MGISELLWLIVTFALIDSIDPCVYTIFSLVLVSAMFINIRYAVKVGIVFVASLYFGYVVFGALLRYIAVRLPSKILVALLLTYGFILLLHNFTLISKKEESELLCRENDIPCKVASIFKLDRLVNKGLPLVFVIGLVSSFTILPCSAGLYIAYNVITKNFELWVWLISTLLYVAIFISPLILLFIALIYVSKLKTVYNVVLKHERLFKITGSLIIISTAMYILLTR